MNKNVKINSSMKVITGPDTGWSYANVQESKSINSGTPKYSASLIIPKSDTKIFIKIEATIEATYTEDNGKLKANDEFAPALSVITVPLHNGNMDNLKKICDDKPLSSKANAVYDLASGDDFLD